MDIRDQLELVGLTETVRLRTAGAGPRAEMAEKRVMAVHDIRSRLPEAEELAFLHSGLCQTCLPHARPASNRAVWRRHSGRFTLLVVPGVIDAPGGDGKRGRRRGELDDESMYAGVPYGSKARLILIYLQTRGVKSAVVPMGENLSAWMRSLGLAVTGGARGTIAPVREQVLRIARCQFSFSWTEADSSGEATRITDTRIADGQELWRGSDDRERWPREIVLSDKFHAHLQEHAVPLDNRAISRLSGNSMALDLYALFAHRLPRLKTPLTLRWASLCEQLGTESEARNVAAKIRLVLPDVLDVYPGAKVDVVRHGLTLRPSEPAVPRSNVRGLRLNDGRAEARTPC